MDQYYETTPDEMIMRDIELTSVYNEINRQGIIDNIQNSNSTLSRSRGNDPSSTDPRRNVNHECGHPLTEEISLENYKYLYEREPVAARVVEVWPKECWKITPEVREEEKEEGTDTTFEEAWKNLPKEMNETNWVDPGDDDQGNPIWSILEQADIKSGIGTFGGILLGIDDGKKLHEPADGIDSYGRKVGSDQKVHNLRYVRTFSESNISVSEIVNDEDNPRHGRPEFYDVTLRDETNTPLESVVSATAGEQVRVHWSRIVHVPEGTELYLAPRMRPVYNNLYNIQKIYGSDAEALWRNITRDLIIETHPQLGGKVRYNAAELRAQLEKFRTGLQRELVLTGFTGKYQAPTAVDPSAHIDIQIDAICIRIEMPKRVFVGSERGELASSQDADAWDERLMGRRNRFCTPCIIAPFINRLIALGVLPVPEQVFISWNRKDTITPMEQAQVFSSRMEGLAKYIGGGIDAIMTPTDVLTSELGYTQEKAKEILEAAEEYAEEKELEAPQDPLGGPQGVPPLDSPEEGLRAGEDVSGDETAPSVGSPEDDAEEEEK